MQSGGKIRVSYSTIYKKHPCNLREREQEGYEEFRRATVFSEPDLLSVIV
jgi:hypothetical protein